MNWVPLLVKSSFKDKERYIWTGKTLKVPFDSKIIKNINLEDISTIPGKSNWVLTLKDGNNQYLLDVTHLTSTQFTSPHSNAFPLLKYKGVKSQDSFQLDPNKKFYAKLLKENFLHKAIKKDWDLTLTHKNHYLRTSGILIRLSGRLRGIEKAKSLTLKKGSIRMQSFNAKIDYARKDIITKWGIWGMKLYLAA